MNIVSLTGSGRINGNTELVGTMLEQAIAAEARANGIEADIKHIRLASPALQTCLGCRRCFDLGEESCPLNDEVLPIYAKLQKADVILLGSPVFVEDVSGTVKNWIDRMAFNCHRPNLPGKIAYVFTTSGGPSSGHAIKTMKTALGTWGVTVIGSGRYQMGERMMPEQAEIAYGKSVRNDARKLVHRWLKGAAKKPSFYSLIVFHVQQAYWRKQKDLELTVDGRFWLEKGWLEPKCHYYIAHRSNPLKAGAARLFGWIISFFIVP